MSSELALRRDYLTTNRRMIIGRSVVASVIGIAPLPVIEDWLASQVRRGLIRRIALIHGVDVDDAAVRALADGKEPPPSWSALALGSLVVRALAKNWRKMLIAYLTAERSRVAAYNFKIATLFDHYCARMHVGIGLDGQSGAELRGMIDDAIGDTRGDLIDQPFRRALIGAAKASARAPMRLLNLASGGALRRLLERGDEVTAIAEVDDAIERVASEDQGYVRRAVVAAEQQLTPEANRYIEALISDFEARVASRRNEP